MLFSHNDICFPCFFVDRNKDGIITENEFAALPHEMDNNWQEVDHTWQIERRKEFRSVIDLNRDGKVDKDELAVCIFYFVILYLDIT